MYAKTMTIINERTVIRSCPFRVIQQVVSPSTTTQKFCECMGKKCAAYDDGYCLRLRRD